MAFFFFVVYNGKDVLKKIKEDTGGEFRTTLMNLIEVRAEWRLTLFLGRADGEKFVAGGHKIFLKEIRNIFLFATNFASR